MSEHEMRAGIRHFLHMGGAEVMDAEELVTIKKKCEQVLSDKKIPSASTVHFLDSSKKAKRVVCGGFSNKREINDDNSTNRVAYVSCDSCRATIAFRGANGEDVPDRKPVHLVKRERVHHIYSEGYYTTILTVCASSDNISGRWAAKTPADVTCKKCLKTETYTKRVAAYNKRKVKKEAVSV